ncbi:hypothetical protein DE146DRAFT_789500 [Phaeosphaeria sp. MPI-PUGE-AT-0046c]|nr:hypothetical protein DE146DRAFT_789500 [Phaeosphaeria sp. MPI-PUGE-AT-0046c]
MAPVTNGMAQRGDGGGGNTARSRRNAFTNAGVNRGRTSNCSSSDRALHASSKPDLASRITYGGAASQDQTTHGRTTISHLQTPDGDAAAAGEASKSNFYGDGHVGIDMDMDIDDMLFGSHQNNNLSQQSALFCGLQPTQRTSEPSSPMPSASSPSTSLPLRMTAQSQVHFPCTSSRCTSLPVRMFNQSPSAPNPTPNNGNSSHMLPKRPVNTYRGKDPIKRLVQNKKLQAIFADKPVPKERMKPMDERMELRMGISRVFK